MSCLNLARYMARPHINSLQTIIVLSLSAHLLGYSPELFTLLGVAIRLGQSLGLHKLSYDEELDTVENTTELQEDAVRKRELGRRVWAQLRVYDNYSAAFTDMYVMSIFTCSLLIGV